MDGGARLREGVRRAVIRKPAAIRDLGSFDRLERFGRISHPVDPCRQFEFADRIYQIFRKLRASLVVSPVTDPDEVAFLFGFRHRPVEFDIGRFVPGEGAPRPAVLDVDFPQYLTEGEYAVVAIQVELSQFFRGSNGAMMGIVEQQSEFGAMGALPTDSRDQFRRIPFMNHDEIGTLQRFAEIKLRLVKPNPDSGNQQNDITQDRGATVLQLRDPAATGSVPAPLREPAPTAPTAQMPRGAFP